MLRYLSRRHERLMDESEQALWDVVAAKSNRKSRIAKQILSDPKMHQLWEARHADLVRPVAERRKPVDQIHALRDIEVRLVHRRGLIEYIRKNQVRGAERDQIFAAFYGPKDIMNAVIIEHRQYMIAVSSSLSTRHLINLMSDSEGKRLLRQYESLCEKYFELYGEIVRCQDAILADAARPIMVSARERITKVRQRIKSVKPDKSYPNIDRQALLARSGRYPITDYMIG